MMAWGQEIEVAHERQLEELRRELGALRHQLEVARGERDLAMDDVDEYVAAGWRLVTRGHVVLDSHPEQPTAWGGQGHRIYVRAVERR